MLIASWHVEARFGHKQAVVDLMRRWWREIAPQVGWSEGQARILNGSMGVPEAALEVEISIADLTELHEAWSRLPAAAGQAEWAAALAPHIVAGSPRWTLRRVM